jgi:hypothetical protein
MYNMLVADWILGDCQGQLDQLSSAAIVFKQRWPVADS